MLTIAQKAAPRPQTLDHTGEQIGPVGTGADAGADLRSLVADLAQQPVPDDPRAVEALRAAARAAIRQLPLDHPLAGVEVARDEPVAVVRLLAHLSQRFGHLRTGGVAP